MKLAIEKNEVDEVIVTLKWKGKEYIEVWQMIEDGSFVCAETIEAQIGQHNEDYELDIIIDILNNIDLEAIMNLEE